MSSEILARDANNEPVIGLVTDDANEYIKMGRIDDTTKGLKVMIVGGAGSGTVTSVSVVTANGISGSVATATTTPAITLSLGAITPSTVNGLTITTSTGTLTIAAGKTLTASSTFTLNGTDGKGINVGAATSGKILIGDGSNMVLSTPTYPTTAGTSGNVLTSNGTNWTSTAPSGSTPAMLAVANFDTDARYTFTFTGGGANLAGASGERLSSSATITSSALMTWMVSQANGTQIYNSSPQFSTTITLNTAGTDCQSFFGLGNITIAGAGITYTSKHIGFKIVRAASGTVDLFATQADATTENASSSLTTVANGDVLELVLKVNSTTSVDYYWRKNGGALSSATNLTSNMPSTSTTDNIIAFGVSNAGVATNTVLYVSTASYQR